MTGGARREIVFVGGTILTMDRATRSAEAVLVRGRRIVAVGAESEVLAQASNEATIVDLEGRALVPGFIDSHNHRLGEFAQVGMTSPEEAIDDALRQGWTTLDELYAYPERLESLIALEADDELRLRVNAYLATTTADVQPLGEWYDAYEPAQMLGPSLRIAGLKVFVDVDWGREIRWRQRHLNAAVARMHRDGWQIAAKSIGSATLEMLIRAFDRAQRDHGPSPRHRIEHALSITAGQIRDLRRLGLVASIQTSMPGELVDDPEFFAFVDEQPDGAITPWRDLVTAGVRIANGSAWPSYHVDEPEGAPFGSPIRLLYQAVTRVGNLGANPEPWMLDQTITVAHAMRALTIGGAYATFEEDRLGSISPGKLADLVILSASPLDVDVEDLLVIDVLVTMVGGRIEWCHPAAAVLCPG